MNDHEWHDQLLMLEELFIEKVNDQEIVLDYLSARKGDSDAVRRLTLLAAEGWSDPPKATQRQIKADKALEILYMFRMGTQ